MHHLSFIAVFLLLVTIVTSASPAPATNAQRLARGLPPLPPKFVRNLPVKARSPTRVYGAKRGAPSSAPPPAQYTGRIQIHDSHSTATYGYLSTAQGGNLGVNFISDPNDDLRVETSGSGPYLNLIGTNANFPTAIAGPHYLGASASSATFLKTGSATTAGFSYVNLTPPNSPPTNGESAIWTVDTVYKILIPNFVNPDGSKPTTEIAYNPRENVIFFVGDVSAYNTANPDNLVEEVFFALPDF